MAFIPTPRGVQLCFIFATGASDWQFCLTLQKASGTVTTTDLANITNEAADWWTSDLLALTSVASSLMRIVATDITSQGAPQNIVTVAQAGTLSGSALPSGSPMCVSQRTALRGRSYRGRAYVSGRGISQTSAVDFWTTTAAAAHVTAFENLDALLVAIGFNVSVASGQHNGVETNPKVVNRVIEYVVDAAIDSQRRRLAGRGA